MRTVILEASFGIFLVMLAVAWRSPAAVVSAQAPAGPAAVVRHEHRVVVATTSLDRELDVDASFEHNINRLGASGFELTALVGGDPFVLDRLLKRRPSVAGLVDHSGLTFAVMARPVGQSVVARQYRVLHVRTGLGLDSIVAPLGADGYRMTVTAIEGDTAHVAFERTSGTPTVEYRTFRNRGRRSWMDLALADPDIRMRITRVTPVALDTAIVELGPPQATPVEMRWLTRGYTTFTALETPLRDLSKAGYRVELLRARASDVSALVVKPAGVSTSGADYDLDDGPWGSACSRGAIAGAAVMPDGDVACAADRSEGSVSNRGLDLTLRDQPSAAGQLLFRGPDCDIRARLSSTRPAAPRVAVAIQFEREINSAIEPGYRVVRALAARDSNGQMRIVAFTSNAPAAAGPGGPPVSARDAAPLVPDVDGPGDDRIRQREERLNVALAGDARFRSMPLWLELDGRGRAGAARLLGCVPTTSSRELATSAARGLLVNQGLSDYQLDSRVIVDR